MTTLAQRIADAEKWAERREDEFAFSVVMAALTWDTNPSDENADRLHSATRAYRDFRNKRSAGWPESALREEAEA